MTTQKKVKKIIKLKPCPFCKCKTIVYQQESYQDGDCYMQCWSCYARGPACSSQINALKDWNTRAK